jgi:hypothetical protein
MRDGQRSCCSRLCEAASGMLGARTQAVKYNVERDGAVQQGSRDEVLGKQTYRPEVLVAEGRQSVVWWWQVQPLSAHSERGKSHIAQSTPHKLFLQHVACERSSH